MTSFEHIPVLLDDTIEGLNIRENHIYMDCTIGGAGHSSEILKRLNGTGLLVGIDQDEFALSSSEKRLKEIGDNFKLFNNNFEFFKENLNSIGISKVDGILLDLGVSSHQFDEGSRGFSYNYDAPLDMRMNKSTIITAKDIVNTYSKEALTKLFYEYGEERWSKRIAEFIVKARDVKTIETTFELVDIIKAAIPKAARSGGPHPAKRIFQALRIETNDELGVLRRSLGDMIESLNPGGRICVISFHSLEDRIVKDTFKYYYLDCICPPEVPICTCDKKREIEIITRKPITASKEELSVNNRAHSAKLRIAEKLEV